MAFPYSKKMIVAGNQVEYYQYKKYVWRQYKLKKDKKRKIQLALNFDKKKHARQNLKRSVNRSKTQIRRLINSNPQLNKFLTLTFKKNITDLKIANYIFNQFIKRMIFRYPKFLYLAVPEFQKRGAIHYHLVCNLPFVDSLEIEKIWRQGFINIKRLKNVNNIGAYMSKYLSKKMPEKLKNKKRFFCSKSLFRPIEFLGLDAEKFFNKHLKNLSPVYKKEFSSEWVGLVQYLAFTIKK